jgi:hypothetical protein
VEEHHRPPRKANGQEASQPLLLHPHRGLQQQLQCQQHLPWLQQQQQLQLAVLQFKVQQQA